MTVIGPPDWSASPYKGVNPARIEQHENVTPKLLNADNDLSRDYSTSFERTNKRTNGR
jgi:hypothetical protein